METAIICVGNRFVAGDDLGCRVFDHLNSGSMLPKGVTLTDGGLGGLNLLGHMEGRERVIFVDSVEGFAAPGEVVAIPGKALAYLADGYGHSAGIPYLVGAAPVALDKAPREITIIGAEGYASEETVALVALKCVEAATRGRE